MILFPRFDGVAACSEIGGDAWFPDPGGDAQRITRQAQDVCRRCDVREACLQWALANDEWGTWGGLTEDERRRLPGTRRVIPVDDIDHGTEAGEKQHRRRGENPCWHCRDATRLANTARRERQETA